MDLLCSGIADWCKKYGAVSDEDYPVVLYGIQVMLNTSLKLLGIFLVGVFLHRLAAVLLSTAVFCSMRYWTGGWHSRSHMGCFCTMLVPCVFPALLLGVGWEWKPWILGCALACSIYRILRYAPCNSEVTPIEDAGILKVKRIGGLAETLVLGMLIVFCPCQEFRLLVLLPLCVCAALLKK